MIDEGLLDRFFAPSSPLSGLLRPPDLDDVRRCEARAHGPDDGHPLHQTCRCSDSCRREGGYWLFDVFLCKALLNKII